MNEILKRIKSGAPSVADISYIEGLLRFGSEDQISKYIVAYLKFAPAPNEELAIDMAMKAGDSYIVSEVIQMLRYRGCVSPSYARLVRRGICWPISDLDSVVFIASIGSIKYVDVNDEDVRACLRRARSADNEVVRDMLVHAAQEYLKIPKGDHIYTDGSGNLLDRAREDVRAWVEAL